MGTFTPPPPDLLTHLLLWWKIFPLVSGLSVTVPEWKCGIFSYYVGLLLGNDRLYFLVRAVFEVCSFRKRPVYCIGSNITSLCGVVRFATCLTGWVESSRFSVKFIIAGARVVCVNVDTPSIILVAFNLLSVRHSVHLSFIKWFQTM